MPRVTVEPHAPVRSLAELSGMAAHVEGRVGAAYAEAAARMSRTGRTDLAVLFERLARDALRRRDEAHARHRTLADGEPEASVLPGGMMRVFDDEGAAATAPELPTPYGILAMAARNAERIFAFWTYVAAHAPSAEVRDAAEQMARDGLTRVAALRHQRRRAFHEERGRMDGTPWSLEDLELRLAGLLEAAARQTVAIAEAARLDGLSGQARERAMAMRRVPLGTPQLLRRMRPETTQSCRPTAEFLADCYLELAERVPAQEARERAQRYAAELLDCMSATALIDNREVGDFDAPHPDAAKRPSD